VGLVELVNYILRLFKDDTKTPTIQADLQEDTMSEKQQTQNLNNGLKNPPKKQARVPRKRFDRNR
jgi:hypothetical protein